MSLLAVDNLQVCYHVREGMGHSLTLRAVDGVSFSLDRGESVGLVGESGCGKSSLGYAVLGLVGACGGCVRLEGRDISTLTREEQLRFRRLAQMVFQDPYGSLNPRMTIGTAIGEVLHVHGLVPKRDRRERVGRLLEAVGLGADYMDRYPHEFSGGQRQRVGIARALAVDPSLIIADEPVSALDVSVQVQILNLLADLQKERNLSYLLIAHDLAVIRYVCDRVMVMYRGRIVESGSVHDVFPAPGHPYTRVLLSAVPDVDRGLRSRREKSDRIIPKGDVPSPVEAIPGCPFHPRCYRAEQACRAEAPPTVDLGKGHLSVCRFAASVSTGDAPRGTVRGVA